jgi:hypothetical protein
MGGNRFQFSEKGTNILCCCERNKNSNNTRFLGNSGEGLFDRRSIGDEDESKVGTAEPRILSGEIPEAD